MQRLLDIVLAAVGLLVGLPLMAFLWILGYFDTGAPLFRQERVGRHQRPFILVKFRTMKLETQSVATHLANPSSVTSLGAFLRRTKLDELAQLWNVLKGEMSLVGPRPLLMTYVPLYDAVQARRHEVRPGLTGLAQVMGRNALTWEQKFALDVEYVTRRSFRLDLWILWMTVVSVLRREGISADGEATMPAFTGNGGSSSGGGAVSS